MLTSMDEVPEARSPVIPVAVREHVEVVHLTKRLLCAWAGLQTNRHSTIVLSSLDSQICMLCSKVLAQDTA